MVLQLFSINNELKGTITMAQKIKSSLYPCKTDTEVVKPVYISSLLKT